MFSLPPEMKILSVRAKSALFHMKTRICLKYFVNDCSYGMLNLKYQLVSFSNRFSCNKLKNNKILILCLLKFSDALFRLSIYQFNVLFVHYVFLISSLIHFLFLFSFLYKFLNSPSVFSCDSSFFTPIPFIQFN